MVEKKLRGFRENKTGGSALTAALVCLSLLLFACQGLVFANEAAARRAWGGGVPAALSQGLADIQSLEDILKVAVQNNQAVKIAELSIEEALAGGRKSMLPFGPSLMLRHSIQGRIWPITQGL